MLSEKALGMESKNFSIIIPAYNEEGGIGKTLDALFCYLSTLPISSEVLVVDDGSTDRTGSIALEKGAKIVTHAINLGYGAAIKSGVKVAKYSTIILLDADGTYPIEVISSLMDSIPLYDMVVGARIGKDVSIPFFRRLPKWILNQVANYLSNSKILDLNSGLRAIKKDVFMRFLKILPSGFSLTTTITLALQTNGYAIHYMPINYYTRIGKSKIRPIYDTFNFLLLILRTSLLFNPLKIFLTLGLGLIAMSLLFLFYSFFFLPKLLDNTATILFIGGLQMVAVGMIADLVNRRMD